MIKRLAIIAVASLLALGAGLVIGGPAKAPTAIAATTSTTATTAASTGTTQSKSSTTPTATTTAAEAEPEEPSYDWGLIALEGLLVIGFIALGVRSGGIG